MKTFLIVVVVLLAIYFFFLRGKLGRILGLQ